MISRYSNPGSHVKSGSRDDSFSSAKLLVELMKNCCTKNVPSGNEEPDRPRLLNLCLPT